MEGGSSSPSSGLAPFGSPIRQPLLGELGVGGVQLDADPVTPMLFGSDGDGARTP